MCRSIEFNNFEKNTIRKDFDTYILQKYKFDHRFTNLANQFI